MRRGYGSRDRGSKDKRAKKSKQKSKEAKRTVRHPVFGEIPMMKVCTTDESGREFEYWDYDPDYKPSLPPGAVRGNIRKQEFCRMCHKPRYFYVNVQKTCIQCGQDFIFSAKEQKYWYESLKFHFDSFAIRCPKCRRRRRSEKALNKQIAVVKKALQDEPYDPSLLLSLAQAIVRYHQRTGSGNLDEAISSCRQAIKKWPAALEALFWEGLCHLEAGRQDKATTLFDHFVAKAKGKGKYKLLVKEARSYL
jgi:tetratricopeptide (TPR) repeat protein